MTGGADRRVFLLGSVFVSLREEQRFSYTNKEPWGRRLQGGDRPLEAGASVSLASSRGREC